MSLLRKLILGTPLLEACAMKLLRYWRLLRHPVYRAAEAKEKSQLADLRTTIQPLNVSLPKDGKPALVIAMSRVEDVVVESVFRYGMIYAGYTPELLMSPRPHVQKAYRLFGHDGYVSWSSYLRTSSSIEHPVLRQWRDIDKAEDLLALRDGNAMVGRTAASTAMRAMRWGHLDLRDNTVRRTIETALYRALASADGARRILAKHKPQAMLVMDRGYTPIGELFDETIGHDIPVYIWNAAQRQGSIMMKRFDLSNRDMNHFSLSAESWAYAKQMEWRPEYWRLADREFTNAYASGDWFAEVGTQFGKHVMPREDLIQHLALDPAKKTAVVYAHIFWDATFFWGEDLFSDYETWLLKTVQAAVTNSNLNWIIKAHPANVVKNRRDGVAGASSEELLLQKEFSKLPDHVKVIPADTDISTLSVFACMDYCVTVRGTVGIESACMGIPTLTAGTGRYDRLGFTRDFDTQESYLAALSHLQEIPALTAEERELARRFAFALFMLRPLNLSALKVEYLKDAIASQRVKPAFSSAATLMGTDDVAKVGEWMASGKEDYMDWDWVRSCMAREKNIRPGFFSSRDS